MLRFASLLTLLPVVGLLGQSPVLVTIGDSAGGARYTIIRRLAAASQPDSALVRGVGRATFRIFPHDSAATIVRSDDPGGAPVHVRVSSASGTLSGTGAVVAVRVVGDSVSIEAHDRAFPIPFRRP